MSSTNVHLGPYKADFTISHCFVLAQQHKEFYQMAMLLNATFCDTYLPIDWCRVCLVNLYRFVMYLQNLVVRQVEQAVYKRQRQAIMLVQYLLG